MLEPAVPVARARDRSRPSRASVPSASEDVGRLEDRGDVGVVRAGVGPDRATDRARDGKAELEPGQAGLLASRWRPGPSAGRTRRRSGRRRSASPRPGSGRRGRGCRRRRSRRRCPARGGSAGSRATRAKRTIARSSWMLWTVANRSAGPPTRIVVNRAERLVARRLDADPALDRGADRERVEGAAGTAAADPTPRRRPSVTRPAPRAIASIALARRQGAPFGQRRARARRSRRRRRAGRSRGRRAAIAARAGSSNRMSVAATSASASNVLVGDDPGRARPRPGSRRWRPGGRGVRIRDDDRRDPERGDLGERSTSPPARRRGRPRRAPPACRRAGTGTGGSGRARSARQLLARGERRGVRRLAA